MDKTNQDRFHLNKKRTRRGSFFHSMILTAAFIALAINLRAPLTSLPSVITDVRADLHINSALAGLLTTIPVFCFGALTPLASAILARVSIERAIFIMLGGVILGSLLRSAGGFPSALIGTVVVGAALTLGNIVGLMVIARDFNRHSGAMTGVYVMAMSIGAMLTSALTAPLASVVGWQAALAGWSGLALLAIGLWVAVLLDRRQISVPLPPVRARPGKIASTAQDQPVGNGGAQKPVWRRPLAWLLAAAFASHTFLFYGLTAWLPDYLVQTGGMNTNQAGGAASLFQILGILGCFGIPWLSSTVRLSPAKLFVVVGGAWLIMPVGLLLAPALWPLWTIFGGIGSGGGFAVVFMLVMAQADNLDDNRSLSSFVQGIGYIVASSSPIVVGSFHQWSGSWRVGFILLAGVAVVMAISGLGAAGHRRA